MSNISLLDGNIFTSKSQVIVNTVNCEGVMGAGIALECRLRYPAMYAKYVEFCRIGKLDVGMLWLYKSTDRWILNFPTKKTWKKPSREEYLHAGLEKFTVMYQAKKIESIAFPVLGAQHGGIDSSVAIEIMMSHLKKCEIPVEIYKYNSSAKDDLYDKFKNKIQFANPADLSIETKLRVKYIEVIQKALEDPAICQLNQLAGVSGVGIKTLEKIFDFVMLSNLTMKDSSQVGLDL